MPLRLIAISTWWLSIILNGTPLPVDTEGRVKPGHDEWGQLVSPQRPVD